MRNVAITLKSSTNEERSYLPHPSTNEERSYLKSSNEERSYQPSSLRQMRNVAITLKSSRQMRNVAITLKSSTNEERSYHTQVFDK